MPTTDLQENRMPTRNVVLTEHQASLVENLVAGGRYQNASEVLREGLRLIEKREIEDALRLDALRGAVNAGLADSAGGKFKTFDSSQVLGEHLKALTAKAIAGA
jgi:antitoxin ParD1/3/4